MRCNICGTAFLDLPNQPTLRCSSCGSLVRTRVVALYLQKHFKLKHGTNILHCAPERGLSQMLKEIGGENYRAIDINPDLYPGLMVDRVDLCSDVFDLPEREYDLIVHNHVLEHLECNYTVVLLRLAKSLNDDGIMLFTTPILPGHFSDELIKLPREQKLDRFGPAVHVRRFGRDFLQETLGMIFRLPRTYDLLASFTEQELVEANIPSHHWRKFTGASVFQVRRSDLRT